MSSDMLEQLQQLDMRILMDVVRQEQRNPTFEISDWTVKPLAHEKIIGTTGGLYLFTGHGSGEHGINSWSVVLKVLNNPKDWAQASREWCFWKREMLAYQSDIFSQMPNAIRAPRVFGVNEFDDYAWIWIEYINDSTERFWSLQQFQFAARELGNFNAVDVSSTPLPDYPWLATPFFGNVFADGEFWPKLMNPNSPDSAWASPLVQGAFTEPLRSQVLQIWADKQKFFDAQDKLPQVLCHNDFHRRNLMIEKDVDNRETLIAVDWAFCGHGAIGSDLAELIANSSYFFEYDPTRTAELEAAVLDSYMVGLQDSGWAGNPQLPRLGYLIGATLWMGATLPGWAAVMLSDERGVNHMSMYGRPKEAVLEGWVTLSEFLMERADEARYLMRELLIG